MRSTISSMSVAEQEDLLVRIEGLSRHRALSARESDVLAELVRRQTLREWWRDRRRHEQRERLTLRLAALGGALAA